MAAKLYFVKYSYDSDSKGITREHRNACVEIDMSKQDIALEVYQETDEDYSLQNFTVDFMIELPEGEN